MIPPDQKTVVTIHGPTKSMVGLPWSEQNINLAPGGRRRERDRKEVSWWVGKGDRRGQQP